MAVSMSSRVAMPFPGELRGMVNLYCAWANFLQGDLTEYFNKGLFVL